MKFSQNIPYGAKLVVLFILQTAYVFTFLRSLCYHFQNTFVREGSHEMECGIHCFRIHWTMLPTIERKITLQNVYGNDAHYSVQVSLSSARFQEDHCFVVVLVPPTGPPDMDEDFLSGVLQLQEIEIMFMNAIM
ncbi:hypothetical protein SDJN02_08104, partial [Cucurbita argyrosperma subsp. argyrosperma]